ncbi:hypothetical protein CCR75_002300 [Bremia lactucae]|uniref:Uncharacterized protein n=1 Tax=Bremia lactucae TaxID=4779 RepID=A0A976ICC7_BRELC|nr:hypothetical protein CCR75_002300 [Bremia lactucae]
MGSLAIHQSHASRRTSPVASAVSDPTSPTTMASPAVFPPLHVHIPSTSRPHRLMPFAPFPQSTDDAERRNVTALTIVDLLASTTYGTRPKQQSPQPQSSLPSLRPLPSTSTESSYLPFLPKIRISSLDRRYAFPSTSSNRMIQATYVSPKASSSHNSPRGEATTTQPKAAADEFVMTPIAPKRGRGACATGTVNNSRKRQKDELTRLRAHVQELQRELEHVRFNFPSSQLRSVAVGQPVHSDTTRHRSPCRGIPVSGNSVVSVWERMAHHQKEEKSKAETENLRLKGLIQEQLKISKGLEKLLRKRCKVSMSSSSDVTPSISMLRGMTSLRRSEAEETAIFASLASTLDARLAEMDAVFHKSGLAQTKHEVQATQMILDERRGPVMEVQDAKILPFDVASCAAAVWQCMEADATVMGGTTRDNLWLKLALPLRQHRGPDAELVLRCVIRRVVTQPVGRVVFVWESVAESLNRLPHVNANAKGVEIRDCGWGLVETLQTPAGDHTSILQLCSYLMPRLCGVSAEQNRQHIHGLAELVAPCYRRLWNQRQRWVENVLMNGAIDAKHEQGYRKTLPR